MYCLTSSLRVLLSNRWHREGASIYWGTRVPSILPFSLTRRIPWSYSDHSCPPLIHFFSRFAANESIVPGASCYCNGWPVKVIKPSAISSIECWVISTKYFWRFWTDHQAKQLHPRHFCGSFLQLLTPHYVTLLTIFWCVSHSAQLSAAPKSVTDDCVSQRTVAQFFLWVLRVSSVDAPVELFLCW